jgi:hypothetical protein
MKLLKHSILLFITLFSFPAFSQTENEIHIDLLIKIEISESENPPSDTVKIYEDSILIYQQILDSSGTIELSTKADGSRWIHPEKNYEIKIIDAFGQEGRDCFTTHGIESNSRIIRDIKRIPVCHRNRRNP